LIADAFEAQGFSVPSLPEDIRGAIRGFTPAAGNILRNPIDYGQGIGGPEDLIRTVRLVAAWDQIHLVVGFLRLGLSPPSQTRPMLQMTEGLIQASRLISKPMAIVTEFIVSPRIKEEVFPVIERCVEAGLPVYAECGGLILLAQAIRQGDHATPMAGVLPCDVEMCATPQGHGYAELVVDTPNPFFPVGQVLCGHEFHYSRPVESDRMPPTVCAVRRGTGFFGGRDASVVGHVWASYAHLHAVATPEWAGALLRAARGFARQSVSGPRNAGPVVQEVG
jgi:hypothetical protein